MKIVSTLINYGVIQEMNDWKKHFTDGTKGQPKTDPELLDFVEELLVQVYNNDDDKINNNRLAPWIIKNVEKVGLNKFDDENKEKLLKIINWFKLTGNDSSIKDMDFEEAIEFIDNKNKTSETEKTNESIHLQAEKEGRITRVYNVNDGSKRIWVAVEDGKWLTEPGELNDRIKWGVMCQTGSDFTGPDNQNIQLVGPPKGNPNGPWSTQVGMSGKKRDKSLREIKQEGNHQPGSQSTSAKYSDADERIIDFLCFSPYAKENIKKLCNYAGAIATSTHYDSGAAYFLFQIIKDKPDLLDKLADYREDLIDTHQGLILAVRGQSWFDERNIDIEKLALENPEKFLEKFESLFKRYRNNAVEQLAKLNINEIYDKNPILIYKNISSFIGRIPDTEFQNLFNKIDIDYFISNYPDSFKDVLRFLSDARNNKIYFGIFDFLLNQKTKQMLNVFGNSFAGFAKFLKFAESPRERIHQNAKYDGSKNEYIGIRKELVLGEDGRPLLNNEGERITKDVSFVIKDDKKVLLQKERKKFIEKNKDLIKSLLKGEDGFSKEIDFLKFYIPQLSEQEINKLLDSKSDSDKTLKEKILQYNNDKLIKYLQDKKLAEKTGDFRPFKAKYGEKTMLPGILQFYKDFKFPNKQKNKIPLSELKKYQNDIIKYYYNISTLKDDREKRIEAYSKFLEECSKNGAPKEELLKLIKSVDIDPKKDLSLASLFYSMVLQILDKKTAIKELNLIKPLYDAVGEKGKYSFTTLTQKFAIDKYKVSGGDRVMFKGNDIDLPRLNLISGKKYLIIDTKNKYKLPNIDPETEPELAYENIEVINFYVLVTEESEIENGGRNIWVPSFRFDIKTEKVTDFTLNENFKIFENKFLKLKKSLHENDVTKPKYSAIKLNNDSKKKLLSLIDKLKSENKIGDDWTITADHVTINMGKIYDPNLLDQIINIKIVGIGINENVAALKVEVDKDINFSTQKERTPHITLAYNKPAGAKPVMSNNITNWDKIDSIELKGTIQHIY